MNIDLLPFLTESSIASELETYFLRDKKWLREFRRSMKVEEVNILKEKRNILFILGAGSSMDYGFPSGNGIKDNIKQIDNGGFDSKDTGQINNLKNVISFSKHYKNYSIDKFFGERHDFREIGEKVVKKIIGQCEHNVLRSKKYLEHDSWLHSFFSGFPFFRQTASLNVITFNYDRLFQFFLNEIGKYEFNPEQKLLYDKFLNNVTFEHPHGSLHEGLLNFGDFTKAGNTNIKFVNDASWETEFTGSHKLIQEADEIYILGFGYNDITLERLFPDGIDLSKKSIIGTYYTNNNDTYSDIKYLYSSLPLSLQNKFMPIKTTVNSFFKYHFPLQSILREMYGNYINYISKDEEIHLNKCVLFFDKFNEIYKVISDTQIMYMQKVNEINRMISLSGAVGMLDECFDNK